VASRSTLPPALPSAAHGDATKIPDDCPGPVTEYVTEYAMPSTIPILEPAAADTLKTVAPVATSMAPKIPAATRLQGTVQSTSHARWSGDPTPISVDFVVRCQSIVPLARLYLNTPKSVTTSANHRVPSINQHPISMGTKKSASRAQYVIANGVRAE